MKLTTTAIKTLALPPGTKDKTFWDDELGGFGLRLRAKARTAGIDLSQPFFFPPNTSDFPRSSPSSSRSAMRESRDSGEAKKNFGATKN